MSRSATAARCSTTSARRATAGSRSAGAAAGWASAAARSTVSSSTAGCAEQVHGDLLRFFPQLRDRAVTHAWGGPIDVSPTHLPIFGSRGSVHHGYGFTGNGVGPSYLGGEILARLALDRRDELTRPRDRRARPQAVPARAAALGRRLGDQERHSSAETPRRTRAGRQTPSRRWSRRCPAAWGCICRASARRVATGRAPRRGPGSRRSPPGRSPPDRSRRAAGRPPPSPRTAPASAPTEPCVSAISDISPA